MEKEKGDQKEIPSLCFLENDKKLNVAHRDIAGKESSLMLSSPPKTKRHRFKRMD